VASERDTNHHMFRESEWWGCVSCMCVSEGDYMYVCVCVRV